ncbi:PREDICTED: uncharacterized protein LOC109382616 [Hipposideros armiger]|uniref:Uncharacterized protein LOC109382616 n=1 Tax=Hipposideros armiger TaxID=186990 RepID=A0A8B7R9Q7_HIPAR|nr:PREDICTED: uncharacterized protein LOC109382616 [Hipposideros armiger]
MGRWSHGWRREGMSQGPDPSSVLQVMEKKASDTIRSETGYKRIRKKRQSMSSLTPLASCGGQSQCWRPLPLWGKRSFACLSVQMRKVRPGEVKELARAVPELESKSQKLHRGSPAPSACPTHTHCPTRLSRQCSCTFFESPGTGSALHRCSLSKAPRVPSGHCGECGSFGGERACARSLASDPTQAGELSCGEPLLTFTMKSGFL